MERKHCQNQVKEETKEYMLFYCLIFKEYLNKCPSKCSFFAKGTYISMHSIFQGNYEMECPHFHVMVQIAPFDEKSFICGILGDQPECNLCPLESNDCFERKKSQF